jgi:hypothetical protein
MTISLVILRSSCSDYLIRRSGKHWFGEEEELPMLATQRIGRNDTCRCGSGREFKICCLQRGRTFEEQSPLLQPRRVGRDGASMPTQVKLQAGCGDEQPIKRIPVHYTYPEPFGEAVCCYCFPVDQLFVLQIGNVTRAEWVEAGMKFRMEDGSIGTVTQVEPPKVWAPPSRVPDQHGNYARRVLGTIRHKGFVVLDITFNGSTISGTPDHKWYSLDRKAWVPAETLRRGERLQSPDGSNVVVEHIGEPRVGLVELYNLEVEETHTFFVGNSHQNAALVHNGQGNYILKTLAPGRMPRADRFPVRDMSGRIHGDIPTHVPRSWRPGEIQDAIAEVRRSLGARRGNQDIFGPHRGHDVRVVQEQQWLRQLLRALGDAR